MSDRREFLKFLAGSSLLLASPALLEAFTQAPTPQAAAATLASAADALDVFDFEAMASTACCRFSPPSCGSRWSGAARSQAEVLIL